MERVADSHHRAGHGFAGLRKRYIRRAQYLTQDAKFRGYVTRFRAHWNCEHPKYALSSGDPSMLSFIPSDLYRDWKENRRRYENRISDFERMERSGATPEELLAEIKKRSELIRAPAASAIEHWVMKIERTVQTFFPFEDFPNPYPNKSLSIFGSAGHFPPARVFIGIALQTDPRLISDVESLFEPMELEPIDLFPYGPGTDDFRDEAEGENWDDDPHSTPEPEVGSPADLQWYLPLYPGITEKDLREAAPQIVQRVNEIYATRTTTARVFDLRQQGLTHLEIANRLGLTESTVAAVLKKSDHAQGKVKS